jgi:cyclophilin family peptidyl-prolyl cis-trans isomerase
VRREETVAKKGKAHKRQLDRARQRRSAFERRQRRRQMMTRAVVAGVVLLVSLGMILTLMPGDLSAVFGGAEEPPEIEEPPLEDQPEIGGVACDGEVPEAAGEEKPQWDDPPEMAIDPEADYEAVIVTSCGEITLQLSAADAPETVNNFVFLADQGFFEGVTFHRVIPGFMIQGGDPTGTGMGGPGYRFADELELAEERGYPRGTLAMANAGPDTNGSQFFIVHRDAPHLPPDYTVFGEVTDGMEAVDEIAAVPTGDQDRPLQDAYIESVTVTGPGVDDTDDRDDDDGG